MVNAHKTLGRRVLLQESGELLPLAGGEMCLVHILPLGTDVWWTLRLDGKCFTRATWQLVQMLVEHVQHSPQGASKQSVELGTVGPWDFTSG